MQLQYPVPAASPITQTFAQHVLRANANGWSNYNGGIDYAVPVGTPVEAAQDGLVTVVRSDATGYGTHVRIQHGDGYLTIYAHLSVLLVQVGDRVEPGDVIGLSGSTGNSTGPHLHFELRKDNVAIDPQPLLTADYPTAPAPRPDPKVGGLATLRPGWNLRAGPGTDTLDMGTTDAPIAVDLKDRQGDYYRITFDAWVHKDSLA